MGKKRGGERCGFCGGLASGKLKEGTKTREEIIERDEGGGGGEFGNLGLSVCVREIRIEQREER